MAHLGYGNYLFITGMFLYLYEIGILWIASPHNPLMFKVDIIPYSTGTFITHHSYTIAASTNLENS